MIVFNDTLGAYGGGQTLMLRMCTWLIRNGISATILCDNADNTEIVDALEKLGVRIIVVSTYDLTRMADTLKELQAFDEIKVINFAWNQYLSVEIAKKKAGLLFDNFIYCIHPQTFMKGMAIGLKVLRLYLIREYGGILDRVNQNKALLMMDESDWKITEEYFGRSFDIQQPIIRIPVFVEEDEHKEDIIRDGYESCTIITSARAEFPFKGYMIGLLGTFAEIKNKYAAAKLTVVSGGNDFQQLEDAIQALPEHVRADVELHAWMAMEKLLDLTKKAKLVIGMGTTVLDAARLYKPCIPVCTYTMDCLADGYFDENPEYTIALAGEKPVDRLISNVFDMSYDQYHDSAERSFGAVREYYEIGNIMQKLISLETRDKGCILRTGEILEHRLGNVYRKIRYRNQREFDYKKIKKET